MELDKEEFSFEWEERTDEVPFKTHMLAGSIAGIAEHTLLLPLDNIKTHLQTKSHNLKFAVLEIQSKGISSFYRGSSIIALGCIPSHALFFMSYEFMKKRVSKNNNEIDVFGNMVVGGSATVFHELIMTPCELIKQRSQLLSNQSYFSIISKTYKKEGFLTFWRSFPVNFLGSIPNGMIFVSANENLKNMYRKHVGEMNMRSYFYCAALSGIISACFTTPLDNIKTKLNVQQIYIQSVFKQSEKHEIALNRETKIGFMNNINRVFLQMKRGFKKDGKSGDCYCRAPINDKMQTSLIKYPNAICSIKIIMKEEGYKGFFRGNTMRMGTQSMSSAISWCVYEYTKTYLTPIIR